MPKRILYWFRNDLRLHDNEAFSNAVAAAEEIIPVYVFDTRAFSINKNGFRNSSVLRTNFLVKAVANLKQLIADKGGDLIIRIGEPEQIIAELANQFMVNEVHASKEITLHETNIESSLSKRLKVINVDFELIWMNTLVHPHDLTFYVSRLPQQYHLFRLAVQSAWKIRVPFQIPATVNLPQGIVQTEIPSLEVLGYTAEEVQLAANQNILPRLEEELLQASEQQQLSAQESIFWVTTGLLSPRTVYQNAGETEFRVTLLKELLWRDYLHFTALRYGTRIFKPSGIRHDINKRWSENRELFNQWKNAQTPDEEINHILRKLQNTGYLTYVESRVAAEYLINELGINWTWGAEWFESNLLNFEVAIDWGNWNYFAQVGMGEAPLLDLID